MNLITRTIPILIIGFSALALSTTSQAGSRSSSSSFSFSFSNGYQAPHYSRPVQQQYYRPHARAYNRHAQPLAHGNTYVENYSYSYSENRVGHGARNAYRGHRGGNSRGHGGNYGRPSHTGYARNGHY